jgi:hypothetical protein
MDRKAVWGAEAFVFEALDSVPPVYDPTYNPRADLEVLYGMWLEKLTPLSARGYNRPLRLP